jgi:hypothetical protein
MRISCTEIAFRSMEIRKSTSPSPIVRAVRALGQIAFRKCRVSVADGYPVVITILPIVQLLFVLLLKSKFARNLIE